MSARSRILWVFDENDLAKLDDWLAKRPPFNKVVAMHHEDTGAVSVCFFDGDYEAGIVRCATQVIADMTAEQLDHRGISIVSNTGGRI